MTAIIDFFNNDYITFAAYDNSRKIPSITDGLKTSQRKVLYTILKNNIDSDKKEIKVEQLAAKASEQTSYLHGSTSLVGVSVGLAQRFVGSNNINLLEPDGNFGTRFVREPSAGRYIYTYLSDIAKSIIKKEDEPILEEQTFEGDIIEPKYYYPIIPLVLVNGSDGLSVGFTSNIAPRDPKQIIKWLEHKLKTGKSQNVDFLPYFKGFKGIIEKSEVENKIKYIIKGDYQQDSVCQLTITELPIKYTLASYLKVLDSLCDKNIIKSYKDLSDNDQFRFEIKVHREFFENKTKEDVLQVLKLIENVNDILILLDKDNKIKEYKNLIEILEEYYEIRLQIYQKRLNYKLQALEKELEIFNNKKKFINGVIQKKIMINESLTTIIKQIESLDITKIEDSFDYLLDLKVSSFSIDKIISLEEKIKDLTDLYNTLKATTAENLWLNELKDLEKLI